MQDLVTTTILIMRWPLDVVCVVLEALRALPLALPAIFALAATPTTWVLHGGGAAKQYPFVTIAATGVGGALLWLCWLLFGNLATALLSTVWWLLWYTPLIYALVRALWIVCRRYVLGRLGWRQRVESASMSLRDSLQTRFQAALQALVAQAFRWNTAVEPVLPT